MGAAAAFCGILLGAPGSGPRTTPQARGQRPPSQRRAPFPRETSATLDYNRAVNDLKWDDAGLITAVVQDRLTGQVRMVAWMNREALDATLSSGFATFYSRSRRALWRKGETSGHVLRVYEVAVDCDGDTLLVLVDPEGPSCHTGRATCFFRRLDMTHGASEASSASDSGPLSSDPPSVELADPFLLSLEAELERRSRSTAQRSYTRSLLDGGVAKISEKISEEAAELNAALAGETDERVASEAADVVYHLMVGLRARAVAWRRVIEVLAKRAGQSGHAEKASRKS
jgi:phosphoribosyl-AMP cyclohydrolase / phosphoribosyl-ATP pyrophosphohydrolase